MTEGRLKCLSPERDDWPLPDPKGQSLERVREIRDDIRAHVTALVAKLNLSAAPAP